LAEENQQAEWSSSEGVMAVQQNPLWQVQEKLTGTQAQIGRNTGPSGTRGWAIEAYIDFKR